ncbi:MAG: type II secretion system protein GspG [Sandaracinaceae bacterium]|nr:type II secretion system protein GspG [Sandaracinaceae bacterium]
MARKKHESALTMPWQARGAWLRELFFGRRVRYLPWIVLGVLSLAGLLFSAHRRAQVRQTRVELDRVHRALTAFRLDFGRCPSSMTELVHPPRSGVRYLEEEPLDAWGNPLWVRCPGRYDEDDADVVSAGPSGNFLIDDNIW